MAGISQIFKGKDLLSKVKHNFPDHEVHRHHAQYLSAQNPSREIPPVIMPTP